MRRTKQDVVVASQLQNFQFNFTDVQHFLYAKPPGWEICLVEVAEVTTAKRRKKINYDPDFNRDEIENFART